MYSCLFVFNYFIDLFINIWVTGDAVPGRLWLSLTTTTMRSR